MPRKIIKESSEQLDEFKASDGQGETADPIAKDSSRPADKHNGEIAIPDFATKIEGINAVVQHLSGLPKEKINDIFKGMTAGHDHSKSKRPRDQENGEVIGHTYRSPTSVKLTAKEDIDEIFTGDELSEEIKEKATVVFEAAVNAKLSTELVRIEEENELFLEETIETIRAELVESVDKYLSYAVEEWVKENRLAIESSLKTEVVEDFITGLKGLFEDHYIDIPESKVDVIEQLTNRVEELEAQLNEEIERSINLSQEVTEATVAAKFAELSESLALTQVEKLRTLSEGLEYNSVEEFTKKLGIIKETYFPTDKKTSGAESLTESVDYDNDGGDDVKPTGVMSHYVDSLSRLSKK